MLRCAAPGEGGERIFYWDPTSTAINKTDMVVKPNSFAATDPGRWMRLGERHLYSVLWFGARGNYKPFEQLGGRRHRRPPRYSERRQGQGYRLLLAH